MTWCENNGIDYIFGLSGTRPLATKVDEVADDIRTRRAIENLPVLRGYAETRHKAQSWDRERRTVARIEATKLGLCIRRSSPPIAPAAVRRSPTRSVSCSIPPLIG